MKIRKLEIIAYRFGWDYFNLSLDFGGRGMQLIITNKWNVGWHPTNMCQIKSLLLFLGFLIVNFYQKSR